MADAVPHDPEPGAGPGERKVEKSELDKRLLDAAQKGLEDEIKGLLSQEGVNINTQSDYGETPLHLASRFGHEGIVRLLLQHKPEVNRKDDDGWTPLYGAAYQGNSGIVELLLSTAGPPPDIKSATKKSGGRSELQAGGIKVDLADRYETTPLHVASSYEYVDVVRAIVKYKTSPTVPDSERNLNREDKSGRTALYIAAEQGYTQVVLELRDANISSKCGNSKTALHVASELGHKDVVQALLNLGADIVAKTENDELALHLAARKGHTAVVEELLKDKSGESAVVPTVGDRHEASSSVQRASKRVWNRSLVLEEIRAQTREGNTALHLAATEVVAVLLCALSSEVAVLKNKVGETALSKAVKEGRWETSRVILEMTKTADLGSLDIEEALISAARQSESHEVVRLLLMMKKQDRMKKSADVQAERYDSIREWKALHWAAYYGSWKVVWWLLDTGTWTRREMSTAYEAGKIGLEEVEGHGERKPLKERGEDSYTFSDNEELMKSLGGSTEIRHLGQTEDSQQKLVSEAGAKEPHDDERYFRSLDMLNDPPLVQSSHPEEPYSRPTSTGVPNEIFDHFYATIVDFYRRDDRSGLLRRSRKVCKVIYEDGPDKIMGQAREALGQINTEAAEKKHYSVEDLQFRWIHLPANNLEWMKDLTKRIYIDKNRPAENYRSIERFIWHSWYELPEGPSAARFMRPGCKKEQSKASGGQNNSETQTEETDGQNEFCKVALYMPYVTFAVHTSEKPHEIQGSEPYNKLLNVYSGEIIHGSRTLDESYYERLSNMMARNEDQVVTKYFDKHPLDANRPHLSRSYVRSKPFVNMRDSVGVETDKNTNVKKGRGETMMILRVDQLWLWVIDDKTIITSSTHRLDNAEDPVLEKIFSYLRDEKSKGTGRNGKPLPSTVSEMSRFIPKFCIGFFNYCNWKGEFGIDRSVHQIFASSINEQANLEAQLFESFTKKMATIIKQFDQGKNRGQRKERTTDDEANDKGGKGEKIDEAENTTADEEQTFRSIKKAAIQLQQTKDIRDELNMLKSVVSQQKKAWDDLLSEAPENTNLRSPADYTIVNIEEMDNAASHIQESILAVMGLEQNEASINEAVSSRKQTQETIEQGRTLMVFTVITIIFLPLSFLASLFALNVTDFPHASGTLQYTPGWIFPKIFGLTAGIAIIAIAIGFYRPLLRFWHSVRSVISRPGGGAGGGYTGGVDEVHGHSAGPSTWKTTLLLTPERLWEEAFERPDEEDRSLLQRGSSLFRKYRVGNVVYRNGPV